MANTLRPTNSSSLKRLAACVTSALLVSAPVNAAVVIYELTGTGSLGSTGTGSFSFDDGVVGPGYFSGNANSDLLSFTVTLNVAFGTPSTTTFDLTTVDEGRFFALGLDGAGSVSDFNPGGFSSDYYELQPQAPNMGLLTGNSVNENITWSYAVGASASWR